MTCINEVWWTNISQLFCGFSIVPTDCMSLEKQINSLTRLLLVIFFIILLLNVTNSLIFLSVSLLFIIILYYLQKSKMSTINIPVTHVKENFEQVQSGASSIIYDPPDTAYRFCNDEVLIHPNNPPLLSVNQKLVGPPQPRTKIAPVVVPPSHGLEHWRSNNLINYSQINEETQEDLYQSGFNISTCCGDMQNKYLIPAEDIRQTPITTAIPVQQNEVIEPFDYEYTPAHSTKSVPSEPAWGVVRPNYPGQVNTACGYNPSQLYTANLPTNLPVGNCPQDPKMAKFNKNLFTQTIQPGVYQYNQVNEPINSNIGISFQQQL